jgi:hypothetical protein
MAFAFKKGAKVRQVIPAAIEGTVEGFHADNETGDLQVLVVFTDATGELRTRYFEQHEVEAVEAAPAVAGTPVV